MLYWYVFQPVWFAADFANYVVTMWTTVGCVFEALLRAHVLEHFFYGALPSDPPVYRPLVGLSDAQRATRRDLVSNAFVKPRTITGALW